MKAMLAKRLAPCLAVLLAPLLGGALAHPACGVPWLAVPSVAALALATGGFVLWTEQK